MRSPATVATIIATAFLLAGCPVRDEYQTPSGPADGDTPSAPAGDAAQAAPSAAPPVAEQHGGSPLPGETSADEQTADETPEPDDATAVLPLPPATYTGDVTLTENVHCTGAYAAAAGAELHLVTDCPDYQVLINADGLPELEVQRVDMDGVHITYTLSELQASAGRVSLHWQADIDFIDPAGECYLSIPGTETNEYRVTADGGLQIEFMLQADYADQSGSVAYQATMSGELR